MDTDSIMLLVVLGVLVLLSAFFSSAETAVLSVNKVRMMDIAEEGNKKAKLVLSLLDQQNKLISTLLVGNNIVNIGASSLATKLAMDTWGNAGVGIATGLMTLLILVCGEVVPKNLAANKATFWALKIASILKVLMTLLWPVVALLTWISDFVIKLSKGDAEDPLITESELKLLVNAGQEEGFLDENETEMINSIFEFDETIVKEIMVPRIDMVAVNIEESVNAVIDLIIDAGHSRIPAYESSIDNIVGILYAKDILKNIERDFDEWRVKELIRPAYYIPENKKVNDLLTELRQKKVHMAIILDEYGGTAGLITIEDLIEEIIGDIQDEYDVEEELIVANEDGSYQVDARTLVDDLEDALDIEIDSEESESETIGGLVFENLGGSPQVGDHVVLERMDAVVAEISGRRISKLKITVLEPDDEPEEEEESRFFRSKSHDERDND